jgi:hypothetical protein
MLTGRMLVAPQRRQVNLCRAGLGVLGGRFWWLGSWA